MNRTDYVIIITGLLFSTLFYDQGAGLNVLLFSFYLVACTAWVNRGIFGQPMTLLMVILTLLSSVNVFRLGSELALYSTITCLLLMTSFARRDRQSAALNLLQSIISFVSVPFVFAIRLSEFDSGHLSQQGSDRKKKWVTLLVPAFLVFIFIMIYRSANPLFRTYTNVLEFDFNWAWFVIALLGMWLAYGAFQGWRLKSADHWELIPSPGLLPVHSGLWDPARAFRILLVLLNILLLVINVLDVYYLYLGAGLPAGVTHKQFVHQGVGMLMLSIILGICSMLYFISVVKVNARQFTGMLLVLWIVQNLFMVISTCQRNHLYIHEALLTYKRIGVYYWLWMAAVGLMSVLFVLLKNSGPWLVMRFTSLVAVITLALSSVVDFDEYIGRYNLQHVKYLASLDKKYLLEISDVNLPRLCKLRFDREFETDSIYHYRYHQFSNVRELDRRIFDVLSSQRRDPRSFNLRSRSLYQHIEQLHREHYLDTLHLQYCLFTRLDALAAFQNIHSIEFPFWQRITAYLVIDLSRLKNLRVLKTGDLDSASIQNLRAIPQLQSIYIPDKKESNIAYIRTQLPGVRIKTYKAVYR